MNRVLLFCVLLSAATPHARADDTWHNIYHTLKRFFTGGDKHHSAASRRHRSASHSHAQSANSPHEESAEPRVIVFPGPIPEQNGDTAKPGEKKPAETKPQEVKPPEVKPPEETPTPTPTPNSSPVLRSLS
jgi:hypothetical protein